MTRVDALQLRQRFEAELDGEAERTAQSILDELIREQARDGDDQHDAATTIVLKRDYGPTQRLHIYESDTPGIPFALEKAERESPDDTWHHKGRERLLSVEIDGRRYGATAEVDTGP